MNKISLKASHPDISAIFHLWYIKSYIYKKLMKERNIHIRNSIRQMNTHVENTFGCLLRPSSVPPVSHLLLISCWCLSSGSCISGKMWQEESNRILIKRKHFRRFFGWDRLIIRNIVSNETKISIGHPQIGIS